MAEASLPPPFGLTGTRRALAVAAAAFVLTGFFVVIGFPYHSIVPRVEQAIAQTTGLPVKIGRLAFGIAWLGPQLRAWDVDATLPSGKHVVLKRLRVHPAFSFSWLRGAPALVVALRSPSGEVDGTVTLGSEPRFDGELRQVALGELPLDGLAPGAGLDGRASGTIDLTFAEAGPIGSVQLDAEQGSLTLPLLPIGVPFDTLKSAIELGGDLLAKIDALDLEGPLVSLSVNGTIGAAPDAGAAPLALHARITVRDPSMRSLFSGQGVALDANGAAEVTIGGTVGDPQPQPVGGAGRGRPR